MLLYVIKFVVDMVIHQNVYIGYLKSVMDMLCSLLRYSFVCSFDNENCILMAQFINNYGATSL